ncbi:MAG: histidine kinase [Candidatus Sphingomonas colombiensis]|nr:histidine kinase [Sphingomonas sp.]WEK42499.1 MAG: histidine kinase [Sphingomonas sp.]
MVAIATIFLRLFSWKATRQARLLGSITDEVIGIAVVILFVGIPLLYFPFLIFLLVTKRLQSRVSGVALEYVILSTLVLLHNDIARFWPIVPRISDDAVILQFIMLTFIAASALALRVRRGDERLATQWNAELLATSMRARALPLEEIAHWLAERFLVGSVVIACKSDAGGDQYFHALRDGEWATIRPERERAERMMSPSESGESFLWETATSSALQGGHPGKAPIVCEIRSGFLPDEFVPAGAIIGAFPIEASSLHGYVYLIGLSRISEIMLEQIVDAAGAVAAMLDRYQMFEAWRLTAFANARLDISQDMHDSVLQTLAGLRMQVAALLQDKNMPPATREERLQSLQSIIAAEQKCLRELIDSSAQPRGGNTDLALHLGQRVELLSRQWGIDCTLLTEPAELWITPDIALEVEFLVREAVSNAVRHGNASTIQVIVAEREDVLLVTLKSDGDAVIPQGNGTTDAEGIASQSLIRRLTALNGRAYADQIEQGILLSLRIPLKAKIYVEAADR